jgi:transcriptional regulator with XRE-family HTH domain
MVVKVNRELVKALRLKNSWSQERLAEEANVSLRTIQRIENDGTASLKSRLAVAQALGIVPADLDAVAGEINLQASLDENQNPGNENRNSMSNIFINKAHNYLNSLPIFLRIPLLLILWIGMLVPAGIVLLVLITGSVIEVPNHSGFLNISGMILMSSLPFIILFGASWAAYRYLQKQIPT